MTTSYTIDTANTWEKKSTVIPVYTTSFTHVSGTTCGLMMDWHLASGPDDIISPFSWTGQGSARAVTGQVNILDTVNNYFQITGIQLEVGSTSTDFEHRSYAEELALCLRYYEKCMSSNQSYVNGNMHVGGCCHFSAKKRNDSYTITQLTVASGNITNASSLPTFHWKKDHGFGFYQYATNAGNWYFYREFAVNSDP